MPNFRPKTLKKILINSKTTETLDTKHNEKMKYFEDISNNKIPNIRKERKKIKKKLKTNMNLEERMKALDKLRELKEKLTELKYLKKKYDLDTIGFFLASKYRDLRYLFSVPYNKEALANSKFNKDKFIADYNTGYDVYFYVKSDTKVVNEVYEDTATANKNKLKRMFMSGMKKRLNSRVLLNNFIKRVA